MKTISPEIDRGIVRLVEFAGVPTVAPESPEHLADLVRLASQSGASPIRSILGSDGIKVIRRRPERGQSGRPRRLRPC
jgi:hypothetical protein